MDVNPQDLLLNKPLRMQLKEVLEYNLQLNELRREEISHSIDIIQSSLEELDNLD